MRTTGARFNWRTQTRRRSGSSLGREAPDFLDWCSDFLDFADLDRDQEPPPTPPPPTPKHSSAYETLDSARRAERVAFLGDLLARDERSSVTRAHVIHALEHGRHLAYLGKSQAALLALQEALELARRSGRREFGADVLTDVAGVLIKLGQLEAAEQALEEARVYAEALHRDDLRADVLANRAALALARGDGPSAERHARDALALEQARPGQRPERLASLHTSLAAALLAQKRDTAAEHVLAQALKLTQALDPIASAPAAGSALINLGVIARRRGDLRQAERQFEAARALAERSGHAATRAHAEANLGALCLDRGRHTEARAHLEQALTSFAHLGDRRGVAHVHRDLAAVARVELDLPAARRHLESALRALGELGMASEAQAAERALAALPPAAQDPR